MMTEKLVNGLTKNELPMNKTHVSIKYPLASNLDLSKL